MSVGVNVSNPRRNVWNLGFRYPARPAGPVSNPRRNVWNMVIIMGKISGRDVSNPRRNVWNALGYYARAVVDGGFKSQKERLELWSISGCSMTQSCFKSQKERLELVFHCCNSKLIEVSNPRRNVWNPLLRAGLPRRTRFQIPEGTFGTARPVINGFAVFVSNPRRNVWNGLITDEGVELEQCFKSQKERLELQHPYPPIFVLA